MKSAPCVDILFCSLFVILNLGCSKAELEQTKNRRGGTSGLFAFPRVGRSDPSLSSNNMEIQDATIESALDVLYPATSFEDYEEFPKSDVKRAGLIVYPRIGRSDADVRKWVKYFALQQALDKRAGPGATTGVWFGPRLGKRSADSKQFDKTLQQKKDY